ncbi:helix-turn-helix domain-containing protein [Actinocorallia sp. API 0066]|uniref:helix-turn-helix domain-containing protein n=1 Tax=Actinocorallia sp. API 0066 TaxID=2896846 RepID=UPI001E3469C4|nr:helix-turn-helix domain-containing protein [Actinocorallia sp. API 0066]MCD0453348.1 helix-turn-helix domain-containing protein [Actinocorallia sp. API 0066]
MARVRTSRIPDPSIEPTISVPRAAQLLGVSRTTGYKAVGLGDIPIIHVGNCLRVPTAEILAMLGMAPQGAR